MNSIITPKYVFRGTGVVKKSAVGRFIYDVTKRFDRVGNYRLKQWLVRHLLFEFRATSCDVERLSVMADAIAEEFGGSRVDSAWVFQRLRKLIKDMEHELASKADVGITG